MKKESKQARFVNALTKGQSLSVAEIRTRFGLANPSATVDQLRRTAGVPIVATKAPSGVYKYSMGTVPADVAAAGYRVLGAQRVNS